MDNKHALLRFIYDTIDSIFISAFEIIKYLFEGLLCYVFSCAPIYIIVILLLYFSLAVPVSSHEYIRYLFIATLCIVPFRGIVLANNMKVRGDTSEKPLRNVSVVILALSIVMSVYIAQDKKLFYTNNDIELIEASSYKEGYRNGYHDAQDDAEYSVNWQLAEFKLEIQDSIEPFSSASALIEDYLMNETDSINLAEVYELMEQGFEQFYKVYD